MRNVFGLSADRSCLKQSFNRKHLGADTKPSPLLEFRIVCWLYFIKFLLLLFSFLYFELPRVCV